jgi:hypothetical protein
MISNDVLSDLLHYGIAQYRMDGEEWYTIYWSKREVQYWKSDENDPREGGPVFHGRPEILLTWMKDAEWRSVPPPTVYGDWVQAIGWMDKSKRVARKIWGEGQYCWLKDKAFVVNQNDSVRYMTLDDYKATDWYEVKR